MSKSTLKSILNVTGSQSKDLRTGVICSDFLVLVRILAAVFCGATIGQKQNIRLKHKISYREVKGQYVS